MTFDGGCGDFSSFHEFSCSCSVTAVRNMNLSPMNLARTRVTSNFDQSDQDLSPGVGTIKYRQPSNTLQNTGIACVLLDANLA